MKKSLGIAMILLVLLTFVGCQGNGEEAVKVPEDMDKMAENLLIATNNGDYEAFSKDLGDEMKIQLSQEIFSTQILAMGDVIGDYQEDSKEALKVEEVDKNYTRVIYNTKYSDEEGDVIVTMVFNKDENNRKIEGFFMNSPKLQKM